MIFSSCVLAFSCFSFCYIIYRQRRMTKRLEVLLEKYEVKE